MAHMKHLFSLFLVGVLFLSGCAPQAGPTQPQVEEQARDFRQLTQSKTVAIVDEPYLGAKLVTRHETMPASLATHVTLRRKGTLSDLAAAVSDMVPVAARVTVEEAKTDPVKKRAARLPTRT